MIQVRKNVFETNSSSTHSLVMAVASDFDRWEAGEVYYCHYTWRETRDKFEIGKFYPVAEIDAYYESIGEDRDDYEFMTYEEFNATDLEVDEYSYTTPNGEVVRAIARYGYDG